MENTAACYMFWLCLNKRSVNMKRVAFWHTINLSRPKNKQEAPCQLCLNLSLKSVTIFVIIPVTQSARPSSIQSSGVFKLFVTKMSWSLPFGICNFLLTGRTWRLDLTKSVKYTWVWSTLMNWYLESLNTTWRKLGTEDFVFNDRCLAWK